MRVPQEPAVARSPLPPSERRGAPPWQDWLFERTTMCFALFVLLTLVGIIGSLLYYARAVDNKLLTTLSTISSQQVKATEHTARAVHQLLNYVATYPSDGITYRASKWS